MGKNGDDFREGKTTLPVVIAFGAARRSGRKRESWRRAELRVAAFHRGDLNAPSRSYAERGAIEATTGRAAAFAEEAHQALSIYPDGEMRRGLAQAVDFAVERNR